MTQLFLQQREVSYRRILQKHTWELSILNFLEKWQVKSYTDLVMASILLGFKPFAKSLFGNDVVDNEWGK